MNNFEPAYEILKIGENNNFKRFRVCILDQKNNLPNLDESKKNSIFQNCYSTGGWKNVEEPLICDINREVKLEKRKLREEKQKEIISQMQEKKQNDDIKRQQYTHFVSIPIASSMLSEEIKQYLQTLDPKYQDLLVNPQTAHMTLLMLKFYDEELQQKAIGIFKKLRPKIMGILQNEGYENKLTLKGTNFFGQSQETARSVYLDIDENSKGFQIIKSIADLITKVFINEELIDQNQLTNMEFNKTRKVFELNQAHITLFRAKEKDSFDATQILEKFKDLEIRNYKFHSVDISTRGKFDQKTGFYEPLTKIEFELQN